jgi:hypothetical protein
MSLPDTAEYWNDIKSHFKNKRIFIDKDFEKKEVSYAKKQAKKYGFKFDSIINFGKYKGNTLEWIKNNDYGYYTWLITKIVLHPEVKL